MKILLINKFHYLFGGAERSYFNTMKVLEEMGHEVAFFSTAHEKNIPSKWQRFFPEYYDLKKEYSMFNKIKIATNIIYNFKAKKNLNALLTEFKPDVAHLHNIYHHLSPSIIDVLKQHKIPMVMTLHDYKLISPNYNLYVRGKIWEKTQHHRYYHAIFDRAVKDSYAKSLLSTIEAYIHNVFFKTYDKVDAYISPSQFLADLFTRYGFSNKIFVAPNVLLDTPLIASDNKINYHNYALYFGRLSVEKGVYDLLQAFMSAQTTEILLIAGDGPEKKKMEQLVLENSMSEKIIFLGHMSSEKLWPLVDKAQYILLPSRCYENGPFSIIESMSLGKVVIAPDLGGIPEMIHQNTTGFLYEAGSPEDLAEKIKIVSSLSIKEREEICKNARDFAKLKYGKEAYYQNLMSVYRYALSQYK